MFEDNNLFGLPKDNLNTGQDLNIPNNGNVLAPDWLKQDVSIPNPNFQGIPPVVGTAENIESAPDLDIKNMELSRKEYEYLKSTMSPEEFAKWEMEQKSKVGNDVNNTNNVDFNNLFNAIGVSGYSIPYRAYKFGQFAGLDKGTKGKTLGMITSGVNTGLGLLRQGLSGYGNAKQFGNTLSNYMKEQQEVKYNPYFRGQDTVIGENGGVLKFENGGLFDSDSKLPENTAIATGEYLFGLPKPLEYMANVEVEDGEYVKNVLNDVQLAVGNKHEEGGVKLQVDGSLEILSDNLKLGTDLSKKINKDIGINSKKNSTFAEALGKYTKKIGLDKLTEDQIKVFDKMESQKDVKSDATANLNLEYLSGKAVELENRRQILEDKRRGVFDDLFFRQEAYKKTPEYGKLEIEKELERQDNIKEMLSDLETYKKSIL